MVGQSGSDQGHDFEGRTDGDAYFQRSIVETVQCDWCPAPASDATADRAPAEHYCANVQSEGPTPPPTAPAAGSDSSAPPPAPASAWGDPKKPQRPPASVDCARRRCDSGRGFVNASRQTRCH